MFSYIVATFLLINSLSNDLLTITIWYANWNVIDAIIEKKYKFVKHVNQV